MLLFLRMFLILLVIVMIMAVVKMIFAMIVSVNKMMTKGNVIIKNISKKVNPLVMAGITNETMA